MAGGAGALRVSGVPSGGVSGAGAAAADDVGSVLDFLSGAGLGLVLGGYRKPIGSRGNAANLLDAGSSG